MSITYDMSAKLAPPTIDFGPFQNEDRFGRWVSTHHGRDIRQAWKRRLDVRVADLTAVTSSEPRVIDPHEILDEVLTAAPQVVVHDSSFVATFVW
jgi:hypothetical protein